MPRHMVLVIHEAYACPELIEHSRRLRISSLVVLFFRCLVDNLSKECLQEIYYKDSGRVAR